MPVEDVNALTPSGATIMRAAPSRRVALHHDVRRNLMRRKLLQDPALPPRRTSRPTLPPTRCDGATDQALALSLTQPFVYGGEHERLRKRMHVDKSFSVTARWGTAAGIEALVRERQEQRARGGRSQQSSSPWTGRTAA
jgi:hypothetical protein